jgi:hypothetical protein
MRTVIAQVFDYSLDGIIAEEGTSFFDFCRDLSATVCTNGITELAFRRLR